MMNMIMAIQIEGLELLEINQEILQKNLQKPFMSQKKIYKGQLSFQVKIKKILTQDFLKMNQDKLQNSIQLHSKATQLTKMAIKLPSTRNNIETMIIQKPLLPKLLKTRMVTEQLIKSIQKTIVMN